MLRAEIMAWYAFCRFFWYNDGSAGYFAAGESPSLMKPMQEVMSLGKANLKMSQASRSLLYE